MLAEDVVPGRDVVSICYRADSGNANTIQYQHLGRPQEHSQAYPLWNNERRSGGSIIAGCWCFRGYLISQRRKATKTTTGDLALCKCQNSDRLETVLSVLLMRH